MEANDSFMAFDDGLTAADLSDYFHNRNDCSVVDATRDMIRLTDIPESGGACMMPGGMTTLEKLSEYNGETEVEYVGDYAAKDMVITLR
jgi:hypothetical protein